MLTSNPFRGFRYPPEVIQHAVWLYHCFSLSLRDVDLGRVDGFDQDDGAGGCDEGAVVLGRLFTA
jgi:hypothetical protein